MKSEKNELEQRVRRFEGRPLSREEKEKYGYLKKDLERMTADYKNSPYLKIIVLLRVSSFLTNKQTSFITSVFPLNSII
jgi:hypothetical protein